MVTAWATYSSDLSGTWLLQGWESDDNGVVTKVAETAMDYPYITTDGVVQNVYYELHGHPAGGVALIGLEYRANPTEAYYAVSMTRFVIVDGGFVQQEQHAYAPAGLDARFFLVTAHYVLVAKPATTTVTSDDFVLLSILDMSEISTFSLSGVGITNDSYVNYVATTGDTVWWAADVVGTWDWGKGLQLPSLNVITLNGSPQSGIDFFERRTYAWLGEDPLQPWAIYPSFTHDNPTTNDGVQLERRSEYRTTLMSETGKLATVTFPLLDSNFLYGQNLGPNLTATMAPTQWLFSEPDSNGNRTAHWWGYATAYPGGNGSAALGAHQFHGSLTIPESGGDFTITDYVDDGLVGKVQFGAIVADPQYFVEAVAVGPAWVGLQVGFPWGSSQPIEGWVTGNLAGQVTVLQEISLDYYEGGWQGPAIGTYLPALVIPTFGPNLAAELKDIGQRFD